MSNITIETAGRVELFPQNVPIRCIPDRAPRFNYTGAIGCRAYLQRLRAAEMAAWEQTGGDYLRSDCAVALS